MSGNCASMPRLSASARSAGPRTVDPPRLSLMRARPSSLRARMALVLAAAVLMTAAAAVALVTLLGLVSGEVDRLASAQRRLELLSGLSGRVGDYALVALQAAQGAPGVSDVAAAAERSREVFRRLEAVLGEDVAGLSDPDEQMQVAGRSRAVARLRAQFEILDERVKQALIAPQRAAGVRVSLDAFAAVFGPLLGQAMEEERVAARTAQEQVRVLRARSVGWGVAGVALALVVAALVYHRLGRSLAGRVADVAAAASAIAGGRRETRFTVTGHDEFSLALAHFTRMARHLARREARLLADQQRLQEIVDARTVELRAANQRLEDVDQARRRFFTDVSHELRTPLTVILGEAEIALRQAARPSPPPPEDLRAALTVIQTRARRLHRRVEDLLRIARSETGQIELERGPVPVADLFAEVADGLRPLAVARGLTLDSAAPPELVVDADREWLRQVLEGLVANAVRHSAGGGHIHLAAAGEGEAVVLSVRDEGSGIPRDELPHVFERFWRGGGEGGGFGIGLALAKWVVERHDGAIAIESRAARDGVEGPTGTCVTLRLPAALPLLTLEPAQ